jgi:hypothetical protein
MQRPSRIRIGTRNRAPRKRATLSIEGTHIEEWPRGMLYAVAGLSALAGLIHLWMMPEHFGQTLPRTPVNKASPGAGLLPAARNRALVCVALR